MLREHHYPRSLISPNIPIDSLKDFSSWPLSHVHSNIVEMKLVELPLIFRIFHDPDNYL